MAKLRIHWAAGTVDVECVILRLNCLISLLCRQSSTRKCNSCSSNFISLPRVGTRQYSGLLQLPGWKFTHKTDCIDPQTMDKQKDAFIRTSMFVFVLTVESHLYYAHFEFRDISSPIRVSWLEFTASFWLNCKKGMSSKTTT
jgi:hypothetical protein